MQLVIDIGLAASRYISGVPAFIFIVLLLLPTRRIAYAYWVLGQASLAFSMVLFNPPGENNPIEEVMVPNILVMFSYSLIIFGYCSYFRTTFPHKFWATWFFAAVLFQIYFGAINFNYLGLEIPISIYVAAICFWGANMILSTMEQTVAGSKMLLAMILGSMALVAGLRTGLLLLPSSGAGNQNLVDTFAVIMGLFPLLMTSLYATTIYIVWRDSGNQTDTDKEVAYGNQRNS